MLKLCATVSRTGIDFGRCTGGVYESNEDEKEGSGGTTNGRSIIGLRHTISPGGCEE